MLQSNDSQREHGINVLVAIRYAFAARRDVSPTVIAKYFRKSGFTMEEENMGADDDIPLS